MVRLRIILVVLVAALNTNAQESITMLPAVDFVNLQGDTLHRDSLMGKIVYINFWSSWSINSRKHNKMQIKMYERFRQDNLRRQTPIVFISISIDENAEYLKAAIGQDDLHWPYNVCDYKGWKSPLVQLFKVNTIPSNFLFDTTGQLIARNKWGAQLDSLVSKTYYSVPN
jgi:hypothetical protein